jgi:hypothetical protein
MLLRKVAVVTVVVMAVDTAGVITAVDTVVVITAVVMGARIIVAAATMAVGISVARISAAGVISADPQAAARLQDRVSTAIALSPRTIR